MKSNNKASRILAPLCAVTLASLPAHAVTYTWTGNTNSDWNNSGNWDGNGVPVDTRAGSAGLDLDSSSDKIVFNAGASSNPAPTSNIPSFSWYAFQGSADTPILDMFDGSLTVSGDGSFQQGFGGNGGTTYATVGNDDAFAASLTYNNYRYLGRSGVGNWIVNSEGTLTFTGVSFVGFSTNSGPGNGNAGRIAINGGAVVIDTEVHDLVATQANAIPAYVEFNAADSSFTAQFGTVASNDFADLSAVTSQFGASFRDTTGDGLVAVDNQDGTFTVSVASTTPIPEPSTTALLGLGGLALVFRRRK